MGQGQDGGRSAGDQEHGHRPRTGSASGQDSLLGAGGRCDQGGAGRLEEEAGRAASGEDGGSGFRALILAGASGAKARFPVRLVVAATAASCGEYGSAQRPWLVVS